MNNIVMVDGKRRRLAADQGRTISRRTGLQTPSGSLESTAMQRPKVPASAERNRMTPSKTNAISLVRRAYHERFRVVVAVTAACTVAAPAKPARMSKMAQSRR
jgi:hypothetical protein